MAKKYSTDNNPPLRMEVGWFSHCMQGPCRFCCVSGSDKIEHKRNWGNTILHAELLSVFKSISCFCQVHFFRLYVVVDRQTGGNCWYRGIWSDPFYRRRIENIYLLASTSHQLVIYNHPTWKGCYDEDVVRACGRGFNPCVNVLLTR